MATKQWNDKENWYEYVRPARQLGKSSDWIVDVTIGDFNYSDIGAFIKTLQRIKKILPNATVESERPYSEDESVSITVSGTRPATKEEIEAEVEKRKANQELIKARQAETIKQAILANPELAKKFLEEIE